MRVNGDPKRMLIQKWNGSKWTNVAIFRDNGLRGYTNRTVYRQPEGMDAPVCRSTMAEGPFPELTTGNQSKTPLGTGACPLLSNVWCLTPVGTNLYEQERAGWVKKQFGRNVVRPIV